MGGGCRGWGAGVVVVGRVIGENWVKKNRRVCGGGLRQLNREEISDGYERLEGLGDPKKETLGNVYLKRTVRGRWINEIRESIKRYQ